MHNKTTHPSCGGTPPPPPPPPPKNDDVPSPVPPLQPYQSQRDHNQQRKNDVVTLPIPYLHRYYNQPPISNLKNKNDVVPSHRHHNDSRRRRFAGEVPPQFMVTTAVSSAASSWLRNRRIRYLFLFLCSPLLLVVLFAALPFLCAAELCLRRRLFRKSHRDSGDDGGDRLRRCEEGCCVEEAEQEKGLLHRYLEDQLLLVRSMYDCGDDEDEEVEEVEDSRTVHDVENLGSSRVPLLR